MIEALRSSFKAHGDKLQVGEDAVMAKETREIGPGNIGGDYDKALTGVVNRRLDSLRAEEFRRGSLLAGRASKQGNGGGVSDGIA